MRKFLLTAVLCAALLGIACDKPAPPLKVEKTAEPTNRAVSTAPVDDHDEEAVAAAPRITLAEAKKAFDAGNAVFVDTRGDQVYEVEHIKGAISVSPDQIDAKLSQLPKNKLVIAYCS